ncbi:Branched-chain-amino-acid aminotransferase [Lecanosticta acicola]|uniref:Branched-chain-amino-acid aminotransferase n=1 Tax=Lecanosticta acicola TaxID=111012 RepID=A0AAI8YWB2_9PEZI|nr:Branched-chain-amino-acid aminotransferase [Lecanosticta acicola]
MAERPKLNRLDASLRTTTLTSDPRPLPSPDSPELRLLEYHTDHMITVSWNFRTGWSAPSLQPHGPIPIAPSASALQFATECFEGLKLFRGPDGNLRLFRAIDNCERMRRSAARVALPDFEAAELQKLIVALCALEAPKWLPKEKGEGVLYVRPTLLGTDAALATPRPRSAILVVFLTAFPNLSAPPPSPIGKLSAEGQNAILPGRRSMKLLASDNQQVRAWPGGFGNFKVGANYGPALMMQEQAKTQGFDQVLWLFGAERYITEAGSSNFFVVLRKDDGETWELVTAPLEQEVILPGIMRASILQLATERLQQAVADVVRIEVVERPLTVLELIGAHAQGKIVEAFVSGTALFITPVGVIRSEGRDLDINCEPVDGLLCSQILRNWLLSIMNGKEQHEWAQVVREA